MTNVDWFELNLIEFSRKLYVKNPARGHKVENTIRKEKTYYVLSMQRGSGNGTTFLTLFPPDWGMLTRSRRVLIFL